MVKKKKKHTEQEHHQKDDHVHHHAKAHKKRELPNTIEVSPVLFWTPWVIIAILVIGIGGFAFLNSLPKATPSAPVATDGVIVVEEYADFNCPACAATHRSLKAVKRQYGDNVEFVTKYALSVGGDDTIRAAQAAECARDQNKFDVYIDALYDNIRQHSYDQLEGYARQLGLDVDTFSDCLRSGKYLQKVQDDISAARQRGVGGTPTFFVNGQLVTGGIPAVQARIEQIIASGGASVPQDAKVELYVIEADNCLLCDSDELIGAIRQNLFINLEVQKIKASEIVGTELENIPNEVIKFYPAFVFTDSVTEAMMFSDVAEFFIMSNGYYVLEPQIASQGISDRYLVTSAPQFDLLHVKGDENAPVTIIEFGNFQCSACKSFFDTTYSQIIENLVDTGRARFAYVNFPFSQPNWERSWTAALASECVAEQGKFWEFHDALYENQQNLGDALYVRLVNELGLDVEQFNTCYQSEKYRQQIEANLDKILSIGIGGTPTFLVNDIILPGLSFEGFEQIVSSFE
ncbi:MAG: DsbA family protein [Candidatus Woesearchaeota archaeon]